MRLFQYMVPMRDNNGESNAGARVRFENTLLQVAGGFTRGPTMFGVWADSDGTLYDDTNMPYVVALDFSPGDGVFLARGVESKLEETDTAFFRLFPDQKAMFRAEIGTAQIINRPD